MEGPDITFTEATIDNGRFGTRKVRFETGRLAKQAGGAVAAYLDEDTMLLSTTTASGSPREQFDFFPLTVDVEERMYAAGKIPGSFFRREAAPAPRPSSPAASSTGRCATFKKGLRSGSSRHHRARTQPGRRYDVSRSTPSASTQISVCRSPARSVRPASR